ncbi:DUS23 phosphatase, partial [Regulus satrapa]|nr:DUS23 phosphatase [Regulus satrapa]
ASEPPNFSWVVEGRLAGLAMPREPGHYRYLRERGVRHLQILSFLQIVEEANGRGEAVAVHCMLGHGRTGTLLACYLCKERHLAGSDAIQEIRRLRPGSIETAEQEQAVIRFCQCLR